MNRDEITIFLTRARAAEAILQNRAVNVTYEIVPGTVRWADMTTDRGFKVRAIDISTGTIVGHL
jgi:hypothetical protein